MIFLVYSPLNSESIQSSLGMADYSYYFVMQRYLPLLREFGQVEILEEPPTDSAVAAYQERGQCVYLSFTPPDKAIALTSCPVIPVFAWEYSTIPYEEFSRPEDNWERDLRIAGRAITHSGYTVNVVREQLGEDFPIVSIPAPLWDSCEPLRDVRRGSSPAGLSGLDLNCTIVDSANYELSNTFINPRMTHTRGQAKQLGHVWTGEILQLSFSDREKTPALIGFNPRESWGVWSKSGYPWLVLDQLISGHIELEISVRGYQQHVGNTLRVDLGADSADLLLTQEIRKHRLRMYVRQPTNFLAFSGLKERAQGHEEPRDLALGISEIVIRRIEEPQHVISCDLELTDADLEVEGFHDWEANGRWTAAPDVLIWLPQSISGDVTLRLTIFKMFHNDGRTISIRLGEQVREVVLNEASLDCTVEFQNLAATDFLRIENIGFGRSDNLNDPRWLGLGIARISIAAQATSAPTADSEELSAGDVTVDPGDASDEEILYTAILNPKDGRKNWEDIITAFVYAFREHAGATLLIKITNAELIVFFEDIFSFFRELYPFKCRLVFIHGYLSDEDYEQLVTNSHYIVNASRGEGQCLPLMEFMSSGVPAIAPRNTAMCDYLDTSNAFVVDSSVELTFWPHDPRQMFRTFWHRIEWGSLMQAFVASRELYLQSPQQYEDMSSAAVESLEQFCSMRVARERFGGFLEELIGDRAG